LITWQVDTVAAVSHMTLGAVVAAPDDVRPAGVVWRRPTAATLVRQVNEIGWLADGRTF